MTVSQRIAQRHRLAMEGPERVWMNWTLVTEKTLGSTLRRLNQIQETFQAPSIQKLYRIIDDLSDNVKWLTQNYNSKFEAFRGESEWTPELRVAVRSLAKDRNLTKRLTKGIDVDVEEMLLDGVQDYFDKIKDAKLDKLITKCLDQAYDYSIGGVESPESALKVTASLGSKTFRSEETHLKKALEVFPELKLDFDEQGSYAFYVRWVQRLDRALREENRDAVSDLLKEGDDATPLWVDGYEVVDLVDTTFLTGKRSALYWYEQDLGRLASTLEDVASL